MKRKQINIDALLKDHSFYKTILTKIYKFNRDINRDIKQHLQKADLEDY